MVMSLIYILLIWVVIIDVLRFPEEIQPVLSKIIGFKIKLVKPFSCSTCMTWWTGLVWLIVWHQFTLPYIALLLLIASFAGVMYSIVLTAMDLAGSLIGLVQKLVDKL